MDLETTGTPKETIKENRSKIKRPLKQKTFFQYISSDCLRIRRFSKFNSTIRFRFFIFMSLDPDLSMRFVEQIQRSQMRSLHKLLLPIVENGWRVFSKLLYNKLIFLCNFAESLLNLDPQIFKRLPKSMVESLRDIETSFYVLYSDSTLLASLEEELERYAKIMKHNNLPVDEIIRTIQSLLSHNEQRFNLYTLFTAINSIYFRRYCNVEKLINQKGGPYFYADDFELNDSTRIQLSHYSDELIAATRKHLDVHQEIALFKDFIPTKGRPELEALQTFYNSAGKESAGDHYAEDQNNVLLFIVNFSRRAGIEFRQILTEEIAVGSKEDVRIFENRLFSNYWGRIDFFKQKLDAIMLKTPSLKRRRYLSMLSGGAMTEDDEEIVSTISQLLTIYFQIARVLASILKYAAPSLKSESVPMIRFIKFKEMQFFIPYENTAQFSSSFLSGKTVRESLTIITKVFLILCLDLGEPELIGIINKDRNAQLSLRQFIKELKRVSTERNFDEIKQKLGLSGGDVE